LGTATPLALNRVGAAGTATSASKEDHVHPTDGNYPGILMLGGM
jgi:hypothetical protein